jgi:hypothetical protein
MNIPDKVTITELSGGNPFRNLKNVDLKRSDTSQTPIKSQFVETISGRKVFIPVRKK